MIDAQYFHIKFNKNMFAYVDLKVPYALILIQWGREENKSRLEPLQRVENRIIPTPILLL